MNEKNIKKQLERAFKQEIAEIKKNIQKENVSWGEIAYLQAHRDEILELGDIELAQWAGITEEEWEASQNDRN